MDRVVWYDTARIERTVTRQYVCSQLIPEEIERLDESLAFGHGLTDCTYWDWIGTRARRFFIILVDLGVPDQIFGLVDESWEDDDLPMALDQVERLALTAPRDLRLEKKFYIRQFFYLLRPLHEGQHIDYLDEEIVPLDVLENSKRPGLTQQHQVVDRVELPNQPDKVFCRRLISLGHADLMFEISSIRNLQNEHIVSYWASYTHRGDACVLFTPVAEYRLTSYLTNTPTPIKNLDKGVRGRLVLDWIHCLVDTLCFVHGRALSLGNIKPSRILLTNSNHIFFSDFTRLNPDILASKGSSFDKESYDYAAPEQWLRLRPSSSVAPCSKTPFIFPVPPTSPTVTNLAISPGSSLMTHHTPGGAHRPTRNPQPSSPQAADIFSLGCVILELLSHGLLKRSAGAFAAHRGARHKSAGRGGAVLDSSFHRNLGQVDTWMASMARDAGKKAGGDTDEGRVFRGVAPMLRVVERMLAYSPWDRPSAVQVQGSMYQILTESSGITEPHCVHQYGWDFGFGIAGGDGVGGGGGGGDLAEMDKTATSPSPSGRHAGSASASASASASNSTSSNVSQERSSSNMRSFVNRGLGHRRKTSGDSSGGRSAGSDGGERWELGSGLRAIQNLRIRGPVAGAIPSVR